MKMNEKVNEEKITNVKKEKEKINPKEKGNTGKIITIKLIAIILVIAILAVLFQVFFVSINSTEKAEEPPIQAMDASDDYIKKIAKVTESNEYMHMELDASGVKVPVPNGYVGSKATGENNINTGYVIYEGTTEVKNGNVATAKKERNQYVWVPVPDISKIYGMDANGMRWGKIYNFDSSASGDGVDTITGAEPINWSVKDGLMQVPVNKLYQEIEPYILLRRENDISNLRKNEKKSNILYDSAGELFMNLQKEFYVILVSIAKYGGFYIGRYETGNVTTDKAVVKRMNTDTTVTDWYNAYAKCRKLRGTNENIYTTMIYGSLFDRTIMWLVESGNKSKEEICDDSATWANYMSLEIQYEDINGQMTTKKASYEKIPTGSCEITKANNIYDLAGNEEEYTVESNGSYSRTGRGGCSGSGEGTAVSSRWDVPNFQYGCRAILCVK